MYRVIVAGRKNELLGLKLPEQQYIQQISDFAVAVKFIKRSDFDELYELYKDFVPAEDEFIPAAPMIKKYTP